MDFTHSTQPPNLSLAFSPHSTQLANETTSFRIDSSFQNPSPHLVSGLPLQFINPHTDSETMDLNQETKFEEDQEFTILGHSLCLKKRINNNNNSSCGSNNDSNGVDSATSLTKRCRIEQNREVQSLEHRREVVRGWGNQSLQAADPDIFKILEKEKHRQYNWIELIASENFVCKAVMEALGSHVTNKYSEGMPGARYYAGNKYIDEIETLCCRRALAAFGLDSESWGVNVQPYSCTSANFAVYTGLLLPGERIMGLDTPSGGNTSHGYYTPNGMKVSGASIFQHFPFGPSKLTSMNYSKAVGSGARDMLTRSDNYNDASSDTALFSSSLPVLPHEKLIPNNAENNFQPLDGSDLLEDIAHHIIGNLLPEEDELLDGVIDGIDFNAFANRADELEEYDLFGSGGGMELESDMDNLNLGISKVSLGDGAVGNGLAHYNIANGVGTVAGEHPYGEHPSRTLFVRNINSNVEDSELKTLFEQYGDIRTLYTACKHRGFVMISYYDIRAARTAMRSLQNKPLRRRKLDIHYSIPKDNPSDKDINQGTLVVFNLDPSVSCDDLLQIFGAYGEVKEIRETPHKRHHKFIEYYDVRAAEAALRSLNRSDIAGKRIKLEPSRPGGARRNLMLQLTQDFDQDDTRSFRLQVGPSIANSPPGVWPQFGSPIEHNPLQNLSKSPVLGSSSPAFGNGLSGLASILHPQPARIAPIGKDNGRTNRNHVEQNNTFQQSHSLPDSILSQFNEPVSSFGGSSSTGSGIETLSGPQFLWGSPNPSPSILTDQPKGPSHGFRSPTIGHPFTTSKVPPGITHGFPITGRHGSLLHQHHHVGSAPSGIPFEGHFGHYHESPETVFMNSPAYGGVGIGHIDRGFLGSRGSIGNGSPSFSTMHSPRVSSMFLGGSPYAGFGATIAENMSDRGRNRRADQNGSQTDSKKQFQLDIDKITSGEDTRTTLMIKNIPNKYTSKMLLAAIDENHSGTYDFLYLPIDFKNKCNVGYAFINMLSPTHIVPFYQAFNGKKWEKFNSEKVASLAYARIQGKMALVTHFQNSSLMNEDKRCRPILFHSEGSEVVDQESLSSNMLNIQMHRSNGSNGSDSGDSSGSPPKDRAVPGATEQS